MRVDTGLQDGVGALRQDDQLIDLTLKVDGQEFRVHKVVLASVSDYFHAMLCGSLKESKSDVVELKEVSAEQVSRLLDFIYTGDNSVFEGYSKEMLECGVYFQVPKIIQYCTQTLTKSLCVGNCIDLLATFQQFSDDDTAQTIMKFIKANMKKVISHYEPDDLTLEIMRVALKNWKNSEWELFNCVNSWIAVDNVNRKIFTNEFMRRVRFKLMTSEEILAVKQTGVYVDSDSSWKTLVDGAYTYHQLPIHQKILDKSIQNCVKCSTSVFVMDTNPYSKCSTKTYVLCKGEQEINCWKRYPDVKPPLVTDEFTFVIEVNNFLITCSQGCDDTQQWQVFDPRTLTWYELAKMPRPRDFFEGVYHNRHLYVLGGLITDNFADFQEYVDTVEEFSFETGTWSSTKKLPVPVHSHAACVFQDAIYVSGGRTATTPSRTVRVDCLNLSSQKWECKAPMLRPMADHKMCVMKIKMKEALVVINRDLKMDYYDPETDQWSNCNFSVPRSKSYSNFHLSRCSKDRMLRPLDNVGLRSMSVLILRGNTIFLLNVEGDISGDDGYDSEYSLSVKWTIPEGNDTHDITQLRMRDVPINLTGTYWNQLFRGTLAFSPQSVTKV